MFFWSLIVNRLLIKTLSFAIERFYINTEIVSDLSISNLRMESPRKKAKVTGNVNKIVTMLTSKFEEYGLEIRSDDVFGSDGIKVSSLEEFVYQGIHADSGWKNFILVTQDMRTTKLAIEKLKIMYSRITCSLY